MPARAETTVLHYVGADEDRGGIISVVRALDSAGHFGCVLGVNPGFRQRRAPVVATLELPSIAGEQLGWRTWWRARAVVDKVQAWLRLDERRVFHGHSRAGLAVALGLRSRGEGRVVASVHCYGRQRWFYRWAGRRLGPRIFWLTPAMKRHYRIEPGDSRAQCIPSCVPAPSSLPEKPRIFAPEGVVRLGGAGALVSWKGWHLVLTALATLPAAVRSRLRFAHIGSPEASAESRRYAVELRAQTEALDLAKIVEWRGEQPSADGLLRETDCLVVASHQEPFSMAMIEALAAGVPVLAADTGGPADVLTPPHNGWLFQSGSAGDLARELAMLVEGDALRRVRITPEQLRPFTAPVVAAQWAHVYESLMDHSTPA